MYDDGRTHGSLTVWGWAHAYMRTVLAGSAPCHDPVIRFPALALPLFARLADPMYLDTFFCFRGSR